MSSRSAKCRRKAEADGLASLMNGTKWRELCGAFSAFDLPPKWRARDLLTGYLSSWDRGWYYHVGPDYCSIEWLELDPSGYDRAEIESILRQVGAPYEDSEQFIRILGYKR
jgi:hypothetical protein